MLARALQYLTVAAAVVVPVDFGTKVAMCQTHGEETPGSGVSESIECRGAREEGPVVLGGEHAYLGQSPPGLEPVPFAPGILPDSLNWHSAPVFSPDGKEVYFSSFVFRRRYSETIFCMRLVGGEWTPPEVAPFSGRHFEGAPCLTPDGNVLFYSSSRSGGAGGDPGQNRCLHYVERQGDGWGEPAKVPIGTGGWAGRPHVSESGNLYYNAGGDLYRVGFSHGGYLEPEKLPGEINSGAYSELDPCIAPDESLIVFFSSRPGGYSSQSSELYVCFRTQNGRWTEAVNLGPQVNGGCMMVRFPKISPDGKYFFFSRTSEPFGDEIYWVSLDYVKSLRP